MKYFKTLIISVICIHFSFIIISQLQDINVLNNHFSKKVNKHYILPFFEQNWGMFSPDPPQGNQYIMIKFRINDKSILVNPHQTILRNSIRGFLNLDQRLMKYQIECFNDIVKKYQTGKLAVNNPNIQKSVGLQSTINYSLFILYKQKDFIKHAKPSDSIFIDLYLIDDILDIPKSNTKYKDRYYTEIKNIFLTTKDEYDKLQL